MDRRGREEHVRLRPHIPRAKRLAQPLASALGQQPQAGDGPAARLPALSFFGGGASAGCTLQGRVSVGISRRRGSQSEQVGHASKDVREGAAEGRRPAANGAGRRRRGGVAACSRSLATPRAASLGFAWSVARFGQFHRELGWPSAPWHLAAPISANTRCREPRACVTERGRRWCPGDIDGATGGVAWPAADRAEVQSSPAAVHARRCAGFQPPLWPARVQVERPACLFADEEHLLLEDAGEVDVIGAGRLPQERAIANVQAVQRRAVWRREDDLARVDNGSRVLPVGQGRPPTQCPPMVKPFNTRRVRGGSPFAIEVRPGQAAREQVDAEDGPAFVDDQDAVAVGERGSLRRRPVSPGSASRTSAVPASRICSSGSRQRRSAPATSAAVACRRGQRRPEVKVPSPSFASLPPLLRTLRSARRRPWRAAAVATLEMPSTAWFAAAQGVDCNCKVWQQRQIVHRVRERHQR